MKGSVPLDGSLATSVLAFSVHSRTQPYPITYSLNHTFKLFSPMCLDSSLSEKKMKIPYSLSAPSQQKYHWSYGPWCVCVSAACASLQISEWMIFSFFISEGTTCRVLCYRQHYTLFLRIGGWVWVYFCTCQCEPMLHPQFGVFSQVGWFRGKTDTLLS